MRKGKIQGDGRKFLDRFKSYFRSQRSSQSLNEVHIYQLQPKSATNGEVFFHIFLYCPWILPEEGSENPLFHLSALYHKLWSCRYQPDLSVEPSVPPVNMPCTAPTRWSDRHLVRKEAGLKTQRGISMIHRWGEGGGGGSRGGLGGRDMKPVSFDIYKLSENSSLFGQKAVCLTTLKHAS